MEWSMSALQREQCPALFEVCSLEITTTFSPGSVQNLGGLTTSRSFFALFMSSHLQISRNNNDLMATDQGCKTKTVTAQAMG